MGNASVQLRYKWVFSPLVILLSYLGLKRCKVWGRCKVVLSTRQSVVVLKFVLRRRQALVEASVESNNSTISMLADILHLCAFLLFCLSFA